MPGRLRRVRAGRQRPTRALLLAAAVAILVVLATVGTVGCAGDEGQAATTGLASTASSSTDAVAPDTTQQSDGEARIRVLFAGSLIIPFGQLEKEFEATNPDIDVDMEGHGSIQVIRHVSDLHESADVLVTADYNLIPMLLYQVDDPDTGKKYADWYAIFATNEMVLAYTDTSAHASEIDQDNWFDIINRPDVRLGCADPRLDANGYRALMMMKLAEDYYGKSDVFARTFGDKFRYAIRVSNTADGALVKVPEVLETRGGSALVVRPYSVQLLPLLESGDIDYSFEYASVAKQHGVKYLTLPPEVSLGDALYSSGYSKVTVKLDFQRFASVKPEFPGEAIRYGVTIPSNARESEAAARFVAYLLGPEGQRIMAENYQPMITPALADNGDAMPEAIKALCVGSE
jgi:molybdate/tungstate transport system substrate-binding protein